ncbi:transcription antitermination factor NusB [Eremococcus coleocola]|uniref:Transcription antitermination protein NusB n=1 Tax=Eremococcus coleocola ACS-139-V-Col8 TaxID=908337 RepID=E4KNJ3_9LACT|nr:transcription antitermination factor NusB [Eremococcus coleocola]EFR31529.1 transcription antitermination factor NusB [Eremococcus coleocola ACS-139-V-Col8]
MGLSVENRSQARQVAVQALYDYTHFESNNDLDQALDFALESGHFPDQGYDEVANDYLYLLLNGVVDHLSEIDAHIEKYLKNWTLARIARIDLNILRVAFFELLYMDKEDVPARVTVDEAIELSKFFSDDKSRQFINGVLATAINDLGQNQDQDEAKLK